MSIRNTQPMEQHHLGKATRRILLAAAVAANAGITAHAATERYWDSTKVGGSEESPYDIRDTANWSGDVNFDWANHLNFTVSEKVYIKNKDGDTDTIAGDFRPNSGDFVFMGPLNFLSFKGGADNETASILKKGDWTVSQYHFYAANGANSKFTMTNETGNVTITKGSMLSVGHGANSEAQIVNVSGDWTVANYLDIARGDGATASVVTKAGEWNVTGSIILAPNSTSGAASFTVEGGSVTAGGDLEIGKDGTPGGQVIVKSGATFTIGGALVVPRHSKGELDIDGGEFDVGTTAHLCGSRWCVANEYGRIYIRNGGKLSVQSLQYNGLSGDNPAAPATITFDGGTLKAKSAGTLIHAHNNLTVTVGNGGGVIDNGGYDITIAEDIGGVGGMKFIGGGTVTLGGAVGYTGKTAIAAGTTLAVSGTDAATILGNGLEVIGVPGVGTAYTVLISDDDLSALSTENVTCPIAETFTATISGGTLTVTVTSLKPGWYVGPANGDLSVGANWSDGIVPGGNATITISSPATLTVGDAFAPSSITFAEGNAPVTIEGDDITGIVAITNLSSASHTIKAKVYFAGDIQVKQAAMAEVSDLAKPHVTFAGGAYAAPGCSLESGNSAAVYSRCIFGKYYLDSTSESRWTAQYQGGNNRVCLADGAYLYVPYAGDLKEIYVDTGAKVEIGNMNTTSRLSYEVKGEMVVTNELYVKIGGNVWFDYDNASGVYKFEKVVLNGTGGWWFFSFGTEVRGDGMPHNVLIGAGGLNIADNAHDKTLYEFGSKANDVLYLRPWYSDYTIGTRGKNNLSDIKINKETHFGTTDENGVARTVTVNGRLEGSGSIYIEGTGRFVCNNANNVGSGAVTVTDTATLVLNQKLTSGAITLGAGTTLALTATSSTFTALENTLNLPTGEDKVATIRIDGSRLKSGDQVIASNVAAGATANVALDLSGTALGGRNASLRIEGGSLILNIEPKGVVILFR